MTVVRLDADVTFADLRVAPSSDGQCLVVYCNDRIIALLSAMGCDAAAFEFSDATRLTMIELLDRLAPVE